MLPIGWQISVICSLKEKVVGKCHHLYHVLFSISLYTEVALPKNQLGLGPYIVAMLKSEILPPWGKASITTRTSLVLEPLLHINQRMLCAKVVQKTFYMHSERESPTFQGMVRSSRNNIKKQRCSMQNL